MNSRSNQSSNEEFAANVFRLLKFTGSFITEILNGISECRPPLFITAFATLFSFCRETYFVDERYLAKFFAASLIGV